MPTLRQQPGKLTELRWTTRGAGRRVRATDDLPLAGLVSEPISNLRFRRVDANRASQGLPKSPSSQPRRVRFSRME